MDENGKIRCLIVDDHPVVREGVAAMIDMQDDMCVIGKASNGRDAVDIFGKEGPDVVLMDLKMPDMDGVEATMAMRAQSPRARIVILTTYDGDEDIFRGLRAGAKGYLLKDVSPEVLMATIHAVYNGKTCIPPDVADKLAAHVSFPQLTAREIEVLKRVASGNSNHQIAVALCITEATVKAHVNSVLHKLDVDDRTHAVTSALKRGIIQLP